MNVDIIDVVRQMNEGNKIDGIAATLKINRKKLSKMVKDNGFVYSQSAKAWIPSNDEVAAASATDEIRVKPNSPKEEKSNTNSPMLHNEFTSEEIAILKEMINVYSEGKLADNDSIYGRLLALEKGNRKRKTVVIDKTIGERLDAFKKRNKVDKSDVLEIALLDFFDKYDV